MPETMESSRRLMAKKTIGSKSCSSRLIRNSRRGRWSDRRTREGVKRRSKSVSQDLKTARDFGEGTKKMHEYDEGVNWRGQEFLGVERIFEG